MTRELVMYYVCPKRRNTMMIMILPYSKVSQTEKNDDDTHSLAREQSVPTKIFIIMTKHVTHGGSHLDGACWVA